MVHGKNTTNSEFDYPKRRLYTQHIYSYTNLQTFRFIKLACRWRAEFKTNLKSRTGDEQRTAGTSQPCRLRQRLRQMVVTRIGCQLQGFSFDGIYFNSL